MTKKSLVTSKRLFHHNKIGFKPRWFEPNSYSLLTLSKHLFTTSTEPTTLADNFYTNRYSFCHPTLPTVESHSMRE